MSEWNEFKIEDFCEVIGGGTPSTKEDSYYGGTISWITPRDLTNHKNRFISRGERNITDLGLKNSSARILPKNSILLTSRAPIGYLAIAEIEVCTNQGFKSLIVDPVKADYNFVYYLIKSNVERIKGLGTGTTFAEISGSVVKSLKFTIPDLPTQTAIAEILSSLDDKIELNNKINQELEALAQTLFKRWFVDFEFPNENGEPYKSSGGEMVDSELGEIPKGWGTGHLNQIAKIHKTNVKPFESPDRIFYHFSLPEFDAGQIPSTDLGISILSSKYEVIDHSILVSKLNPKFPRVWTVLKSAPNSICSTEFQVIKPDTHYLFPFVNFLCKSRAYISSLQSKVTGTSSSHQRVNPHDIINYELGLPPIDIIKSFYDKTYNVLEMIENGIKENQQLKVFRDTLLPKLISGELEVS